MVWTNLTDRERNLDRAITNSGIRLDRSHNCLTTVMRSIGASAHEQSFVQQRILLRLRTEQLLRDNDDFIQKTEKMLNDFKEDDKIWEEKGRKLGFKF